MSNPLRVQMSGPLSLFEVGFREKLLGRGYRPGTVAKQLQLMAHLSRWLGAHGLAPAALGRVEIERFVQERRASHAHLASAHALEPLLGYLRGLGVVPAAGSREPATLAGGLLDRYAEYLLVGRGLKPTTVRNYCNHARAFLGDRERLSGELALAALDVAAINDYVLRESRRVSVSSTQAVALALRSMLRFLHLEGVIDRDLAVAVPSVAKWRLASLVKAVDTAFVAQLLDGCDRRTAIGRRDFAIVTLLSRLGLRVGEVTVLRLEDLDWRAGELVISGKGGRRERLPLPVDVGEAIVEWLRDGRPDCDSRFVFTRSRAPYRGLHPTSLNGVVHQACRRAGLDGIGPHRLRHTAATEMLRAGSSLREVGQVLRHRGSEVTSIYAKVDRLALVAVVQPWPGPTA
jgi:integrase/recombinase XerD